MLKAVLMDIDDTLLDFGKCAEQAMRVGFAEWGLPFGDSTYQTFTRINDGLWRMIERGELTTQQLFAFRWNRIFDALGIRADGAAFEQRFLDLLYETAIPVDGAAEIYSAPFISLAFSQFVVTVRSVHSLFFVIKIRIIILLFIPKGK